MCPDQARARCARRPSACRVRAASRRPARGPGGPPPHADARAPLSSLLWYFPRVVRSAWAGILARKEMAVFQRADHENAAREEPPDTPGVLAEARWRRH